MNDEVHHRIASPAPPSCTRGTSARSGATSRTSARTSGAIVSARGVLTTYAGDEMTQLLGLRSDEREIDERLRRVPEVVLHHVVHHADDGLPASTILSLQALADRDPRPARALRGRPADDDVWQMPTGDRSSRTDGRRSSVDAHRLEVVAGGERDAETNGPASASAAVPSLRNRSCAVPSFSGMFSTSPTDSTPGSARKPIHEVEIEARERRPVRRGCGPSGAIWNVKMSFVS